MKPLYTTIKVTNKTGSVQKLPVLDQLRLLLGKVTMDEQTELAASEAISKADLEMQSALSNLVNVCVERMRELNYTSVTVSISSKFKPYFDIVFSEEYGKGRFYDFEIEDRDSSIIGVDYFINVRISEKEK